MSMDTTDWTAVVDAGARAYIEHVQGEGVWDRLRREQQHAVKEMVLPIVRAAVPVALKQAPPAVTDLDLREDQA